LHLKPGPVLRRFGNPQVPVVASSLELLNY
jgi:hypothetical protein